MKKQLLLTISAGLIIFLFTYAGLSKLFSFQHFVNEINNQPLPKSWTPFLVVAIPLTEFTAVALLILPRCRNYGFVVSFFIMLVFTSYTIMILLHRFSYVPCSCGGMIERLTWPQHLILNVSYLIVTGLSVYYSREKMLNKIETRHVQNTLR